MKNLLTILAALFVAHSASAEVPLTGDIANVRDFSGQALLCGTLDQRDGRTLELILASGGGAHSGNKYLIGGAIVRDKNQNVLWMSRDWTVFVNKATATVVAGDIATGGFEVMPQVYFVMRKSKIQGLDMTGTISFDQKPISLVGAPYPNAFCMVKK